MASRVTNVRLPSTGNHKVDEVIKEGLQAFVDAAQEQFWRKRAYLDANVAARAGQNMVTVWLRCWVSEFGVDSFGPMLRPGYKSMYHLHCQGAADKLAACIPDEAYEQFVDHLSECRTCADKFDTEMPGENDHTG